MEMAYRERWGEEIAALKAILAGFDLVEDCKWAKPCYMLGDRNIVLIQGFKDHCALLFFQGALLEDPERVLVQLGRQQAARVMKFAGAGEIAARAATIKAYVAEAMAASRAGRRVERKTPTFDVPEELAAKFAADPKFKAAFEALTPGRQRGYLHHFTSAKQSATRTTRIEKAAPAIFAGRGFLERP